MDKKPVIIFGAGGLGKVALEIFSSHEVVTYCFLDDDSTLHGTEIGEVAVLGAMDDDGFLKYVGKKCDAFVAIDEVELRKSIVDLLTTKRKVMPINAVHSGADVSSTSFIGYGNLVNNGVTVGTGAEIKNHCTINTGAIIDHGCLIHDFVQLGAGAVLNANVEVGEGAFIGSGVIVVSGIKIGAGARIGAGSVVIKDVGEGETVFGNPAEAIKS